MNTIHSVLTCVMRMCDHIMVDYDDIVEHVRDMIETDVAQAFISPKEMIKLLKEYMLSKQEEYKSFPWMMEVKELSALLHKIQEDMDIEDLIGSISKEAQVDFNDLKKAISKEMNYLKTKEFWSPLGAVRNITRAFNIPKLWSIKVLSRKFHKCHYEVYPSQKRSPEGLKDSEEVTFPKLPSACNISIQLENIHRRIEEVMLETERLRGEIERLNGKKSVYFDPNPIIIENPDEHWADL